MDDPEAWLVEYARRTNTHRFEEVAPLVDPDAVYWFSDGSTHEGIDEIRRVFERNWPTIQNEVYQISHERWLARDDQIAVVAYRFRWEGETKMGRRFGQGRGTSVLRHATGSWRVVHEHLSRPAP